MTDLSLFIYKKILAWFEALQTYFIYYDFYIF